MNNARIALSTAANREDAERIAIALVEQRLAACVNIIPQVQSIYRWQGKIEASTEFVLLIKTMTQRLDELEATLRSLHSYAVPEFLVLDVASGSLAYLDWLAESVATPGSQT